jgi:uncharacterized membrane protein YraQ (UPF0718 family)
MEVLVGIIKEAWQIARLSAPYLLMGLGMGGLLYIFVNPLLVHQYLGKGRIRSVLMAALSGAPIPLCSCGVVPVAVSLKKQGATNGAIASFLISTPETGIDSIALTYALFDPLMAVMRPFSAIITALTAGLGVNFLRLGRHKEEKTIPPDDICRVDGCCAGINCPPETHRTHHSLPEKLWAAGKYAAVDLLTDVAGWFLLGLFIAALITYFVPDDLISRHLGSGIAPMLLMLIVGVPLYICATASTPIAAALVLKGLSPGAALVFLLAGPATNATTMSVVGGILGRRVLVLYLSAIAVCSLLMGLMVDALYQGFGVRLHVAVGEAAEWLPPWVETAAALILLLSMAIILLRKWLLRLKGQAVAVCECGCQPSAGQETSLKVIEPLTPSTRKKCCQEGETPVLKENSNYE